jgi:tetratricopeptide (TPR) repeat protein
VDSARAAFARAAARCPDAVEARSGLGYVALRRGDLGAAREAFDRALALAPADYDALAGRGILTYRAGDLRASRAAWAAALRTVPNDSTARWYLERARTRGRQHPAPSASARGAPRGGGAHRRPPLRGPGRTRRVAPDLGEGGGHRRRAPGKHPSEFPPDDGTYDRWIALSDSMGANSLRVYTIHPPHFYRALERWNRAHRPVRCG